MIKIYDKLWYIIKEGEEDKLSYMCQYEENKSGGVSSSTADMQRTGRSWAGGKRDVVNIADESIIDNTPTKGFYVGCSVSRWSTSNKLFRVEDPRGFTVEIPTDNLATLLHHTTVVKGVVQEDCVWGREGSNHILLPVDSEPYNLSKDNQDVLENKLIPVGELKAGDWVKMFGLTDVDYYFFGRVKVLWNLRNYRPRIHSCWNSNSNREIEYSEWHEVEDDKYINLFLRKIKRASGDMWYAETLTKPKITEVIDNEVLDVSPENISWLYCPDRVKNKMCDILDTQYFSRTESKLLGFKHKP